MGLVGTEINDHLTTINPELELQRRRTYPGMAHFAGSAETRATCRECSFWTGCGGESGYYARRKMSGGGLKPRSCAKYRELMQEIGPGVPHNTGACKYFNANPSPPLITEKR